jgi:hypothetical protein
MSSRKPIVRNPDGNIFFILGAVQSALRPTPEKLAEFKGKVAIAKTDGTDYNGMLRLCMEYVDFRIDEQEEDEDFE